MEEIMDDDMRLIRSDPHLLTKTCEQLVNEINALQEHHQGQQPQQQFEHTVQQPYEPMEAEEGEPYEEDIIELDKKYDSMRDIRLAAIEYGRRRKFAVSTLRSGARQLVLACKHSGSYRGTKKAVIDDTQISTDCEALPAIELEQTPSDVPTKRTRKKVSRKIQCPFQIRAKPVKGQWVVYKMDLEHNHPMAADSNAYAQHRKLDAETQQLIVKLMRTGSSNTNIVKYLSLKGIRNVVRKDIANLRQTHFNPNHNKVNAAGTVLYQVHKLDLRPTAVDEQTNQTEGDNYAAQQINQPEQENETEEISKPKEVTHSEPAESQVIHNEPVAIHNEPEVIRHESEEPDSHLLEADEI